MSGVDVCELPATGGPAGAMVAGLLLLVVGLVILHWVRRSFNRISIVVAPLVLLGGLTMVPQDDSCTSFLAPTLSVLEMLPMADPPLVASSQFAPNADVTVSYGGFVPGEFVQLIVASTPLVIGSNFADSRGFASLIGKLPEALVGGAHTLAVYAPVSGVGFRQPITIVATSPTTTTVVPSTTTVLPTTTVPLSGALTPSFGEVVATANGFTVQVSNYDSDFMWAGSVTMSGSVLVSGSGLVTVSGLEASTSSTVTVTTMRNGYESGEAQVTGTSLSECVAGGECVVGEEGPGGGVVFYDAGSLQPWGRYLEVACAGWNNGCDGTTADPVAEWGCIRTVIAGADGTEIGTGKKNTEDILNQCSTPNIAADRADDYSNNGISDWFLPSIGELTEVCKWAKGYSASASCLGSSDSPISGDFSGGYYLSSSEIDDFYLVGLYFPTGDSVSLFKQENEYPVHPIRAFSVGAMCADGGACVVGSTGPGGGIVFYVASDTFSQAEASGSMCTTTCRYLEAAPANWFIGVVGDPKRSWATDVNSNQTTSVVGASFTGIGDGYRNSVAIANQTGNEAASSAAVLAREYEGGNKSDWFLPSKDELQQLWQVREIVGLSSDSNYWSSSEQSFRAAWAGIPFGWGDYYKDYMYNVLSVRPVRAI